LFEGITVMVATRGVAPVFVAVKDAMFPAPLAARPIEGVLFVQLKVVPTGVPLNVTKDVPAPLHITWLTIGSTAGTGFTVKLLEHEISHPLASTTVRL